MSITIPEFITSININGSTKVAQTDEKLTEFMGEVESYMYSSYGIISTELETQIQDEITQAYELVGVVSGLKDQAEAAALIASSSAEEVSSLIPEINSNTQARHTHSNKTTLDNINQELAIGSNVSFGDIDTSKIVFNTTGTQLVENIGELAWATDEGSLNLGITNSLYIRVGEDIVTQVTNNTSNTITKGTVVMAVGSNGNSGRILVAPHNGIISNASRIVGIAMEDITATNVGIVGILGRIKHINTTGSLVGETWADGDKLYLKPNDSGYLTNIEPSDGEVKLEIAFVLKAHSNGSLYIRVTGFDMNQLQPWVLDTIDTLIGNISDFEGAL